MSTLDSQDGRVRQTVPTLRTLNDEGLLSDGISMLVQRRARIHPIMQDQTRSRCSTLLSNVTYDDMKYAMASVFTVGPVTESDESKKDLVAESESRLDRRSDELRMAGTAFPTSVPISYERRNTAIKTLTDTYVDLVKDSLGKEKTMDRSLKNHQVYLAALEQWEVLLGS